MCLKEHPRELVVLYLKKDFDSRLSQRGVDQLSRVILETFNSVGIIPRARADDNLIDWYRSSKLPGQVILSGMKHLEHSIPKELLWRCHNSYHLTQSDNSQDLIGRVLEFTKEQPNEPTVLMNYECIITLSACRVISFSTIFKETQELQQNFSQLLHNEEFKNRANIIMVDYVTPEQGTSIIRLNHERFFE